MHKDIKGTFIYVTHDQTEAMTMGDRIVVMKDGIIQQVDTPTNIYEHPNNIFVATFLGSPQMNIFKGVYHDGYVTLGDDLKIKLEEKTLNKMMDGYEDEEIFIGIRPSDFYLGDISNYDIDVTNIELVEKLGNETLIYFKMAGKEDSTLAALRLNITEKDLKRAYLKIDTNKIHLFNLKGESILQTNDYNYLPAKISILDNGVKIDDQFNIDNLNKKIVKENYEKDFKGYIRIKNDQFSLDKIKDCISFKAKILAKENNDNEFIYFAKQDKTNERFTFVSDIDLKDKKTASVFINKNDVVICDEHKNILSIDEVVKQNIINTNIQKIGLDYYLISNDKLFSKNKYFLVEKIYDLNDDMLLICKNNKQETIYLKCIKNPDYYNSMLIYTKYKKIKAKK